ncbi:SNF1-interacting protein [Pseudogymnoascus destructans]|uniref:SNF1-interacting protein n=1 Tax=Pseudogymnoascus destructans TaxID=655981 RepID=A0A177A197_9PEZI|nr:SNF1-interacting protein [Pseudogymnoascus destructans]OAF55262.1 SNF1-interacting protein [Pseudogymnoascus destructans]
MSEVVAAQPPALEHARPPLTLLPVGLKEAALDSPTFRATAVHFSDQVELVERWLDAYVKSTTRLIHDVGALEETINTFLNRSLLPTNVSEAVFDHDYTLLAMQRFGEGSRDWWSQFVGGAKRMETMLVEPLKAFMTGELRNFKDARRYLEQSQRVFDTTLARYLAQSKTKEPSSLREDAFQVHETRKAYLKASLDFCLLAPQVRFTLDKLLVQVSTEQWKDMKKSRELAGMNATRWNAEMERIKGWSREMDSGEHVFRRELQAARKEIAQTASVAAQPSRELEDYHLSTVPYISAKGPSLLNLQASSMSEKQGWLCLRVISGKPARTTWARRWFYVKNGIFGWLVQGSQSGGVEESEKIGVLLCNVKPAVSEDRRFCFEVKTKNATILLQAETQGELMEWLEGFEIAKNNAIKASADVYYSSTGLDPAFSITPPSVPEFAAKTEGQMSTIEEFSAPPLDRGNTLPIPSFELSGAPRPSVDASTARRSGREEGESGRDHAARLIQKLDLHRRATTNGQDAATPPTPNPSFGAIGGIGIGSLISASHNILPVYAPPVLTQSGTLKSLPAPSEFQYNTLAPSTLANPPAPTNLSKTAVVVSGERGIGLGKSDASGSMPNGILANLWGSSNWGYNNRLGADLSEPRNVKRTPSPKPPGEEEGKTDEKMLVAPGMGTAVSMDIETGVKAQPPSPPHRKAFSADTISSASQISKSAQAAPQVQAVKGEEFPSNYPLELKAQEAQFRTLFADVPREDKVVIVFRATWNPNGQQEFPGRVYVTQKDMYFYSHHLGLVLITSASLDTIDEVTAAPGKDCDFLFLHLKESAITSDFTRITIKTFLEPLRLLQSRLNYLIETHQQQSPKSLKDIMTDLVKLETDAQPPSSSNSSWEDLSLPTLNERRATRRDRDLKRAIHVSRGATLEAPRPAKFQLPAHPVIYEPPDMPHKSVERIFETSPKSLFHVLFGDKSAVFQLLYHQRRAQRIAQGPWTPLERQGDAQGRMQRDFSFQIDYTDLFRRQWQANVVDSQVIDVLNDHVCYVVSDYKTPWHLPHHAYFKLVKKIVITYVAKSRCKLAIFTAVQWSHAPAFSKGLVERQATDDLDLDALDLADLVADQVRKLGPSARTSKAVQIFGHVGQQTSVSLFSSADGALPSRHAIKQRTLGTMVWERTSSFLETAVSVIMMWTFALLRKAWSVASANSILLSLLALSVLANVFMSGKDASEWWTERGAARYMARLGVGPNTMMSKAVFIADLEDAVRVGWESREESPCYSTFLTLTNTTDLDAPFSASHSPSHSHSSYTPNSPLVIRSKSSTASARRLLTARQSLATQRFDLLVALRVVNRVERAVVQAEWEEWVRGEGGRCEALRRRVGSGGGKGEVGKEALEWMFGGEDGGYCGSCWREEEGLGGYV